jgi:hypothetical protein
MDAVTQTGGAHNGTKELLGILEHPGNGAAGNEDRASGSKVAVPFVSCSFE